MTTIAFTADLHVDDFGSAVDPETGWATRFEDAIRSARFVARTAREQGADALVVAGDYTELRSPSPPRVARILEALHDGPRNQIHVRGNHDQERTGRSIVDVLGTVDGWSGFTQPGIELIDGVAVCVVPFVSPSYLRSQPGFQAATIDDVYRMLGELYLTIARGVYAQARKSGAERSILVGHQQLSGGRMTDRQMTFLGDRDLVVDAGALTSIGFDAVLFGHVHRGQTVVDAPGCPVAFIGSTHRVDFAEADEDKRMLLAHVEQTGISLESISIPARRFVTLRDRCYIDLEEVRDAVVRCVDVDPEVDPANLRKLLEESGAWDVQEIRIRRSESPAAAGGLSESLSASEALDAYFAETPDSEPIIERGRGILEAVA